MRTPKASALTDTKALKADFAIFLKMNILMKIGADTKKHCNEAVAGVLFRNRY